MNGQFEQELQQNHRHNTIIHALDASFFSVAAACMLPSVIIVAYLKHFTNNIIILNFPVFISNFAFALVPFVVSFFAGRIRGKKRAMLTASALHRLFWIPILLIVFFFGDNPHLVLPLFIVAYLVYYLMWGVTSIFWQEVVGRTLYPDRRSSAMGFREAMANTIGFLMSFMVLYVMDTTLFPRNFVILFTITLAALTVSYFWLTRLKVATYDIIHHHEPAQHFKNILLLPKEDPVLKWYAIYILFAYGSLFIGGLYTSIGLDRFGADTGHDRLAGIFTTVSLSSVSVCALVIGRLYDRAGKFWGFLPGICVNILLPFWAWWCHSFYGYLFLFILAGVPWNNWFLELSTILGFSRPEKRHEYLAFNALIKLFPVTIYTNLGGYLAERFSPTVTFVVSACFCTTGLVILVTKLRPQWAKQVPSVQVVKRDGWLPF
jgi:MFS family permease